VVALGLTVVDGNDIVNAASLYQDNVPLEQVAVSIVLLPEQIGAGLFATGATVVFTVNTTLVAVLLQAPFKQAA
jgi:hypothetical protein